VNKRIGAHTDESKILRDLNEQFIDAFRRGSWEALRPILSPGFSYLDGNTGEVWPMDRYIADLERSPNPNLVIDDVSIHIDGDTAVVSSRSSSRPDRYNRYVDTYERRMGAWLCVHACVWALQWLP